MASLTREKIVNELQKINEEINSYNVFIESGTFCGQTIINLIDSFQILHTIELGKNYYDYFNQIKIENNYNNVQNHYGDTIKILPEILKSCSEDSKCIFWLDGHFSSWDTSKGDKDVPLLEECCFIDKLYKSEKGIIFIDDFRLFGTNVNENWTDITLDNILSCFKNFEISHSFINDDILILFIRNKKFSNYNSNCFYGWEISSNYINDYINVCKKIVENEDEFLNFKSNRKYQFILEHVWQELGYEYYTHIQKSKEGKSIFKKYIDKFLENDTIGNPNLFLYGDKYISPSTLRYIKNVLDLNILCGGNEIKKIVEVGGGYGGLCKTVSAFYNFDEYNIVDLLEVTRLQEKYLNNFKDTSFKIKFISCDKLEEIEEVDLFISNYAISELNIETQINYYKKFIKNSKIVYITYNFIINSDENYNKFVSIMKDDGFKFENGYVDYGNLNNKIIAAKK